MAYLVALLAAAAVVVIGLIVDALHGGPERRAADRRWRQIDRERCRRDVTFDDIMSVPLVDAPFIGELAAARNAIQRVVNA